MASTGLKYKKLLRKLFPQGWAWQSKSIDDSDLKDLFDSLSVEPCRVEDAAFSFINDVYPNTTVDLLEDWERLLALPDESDPDTHQTIPERQQRVVQVLTTRGGQNAAFFIELAGNFGFDTSLIEIQDYVPFTAGSRAGDALTNGDWIFAFKVIAPLSEASVKRFRAGSRAGERLLDASNLTLQCLLNKHKPAHRIVLFSFT